MGLRIGGKREDVPARRLIASRCIASASLLVRCAPQNAHATGATTTQTTNQSSQKPSSNSSPGPWPTTATPTAAATARKQTAKRSTANATTQALCAPMPVTAAAVVTKRNEAVGRSCPKYLLPKEDNDMTDIF